MSLSIIDRNDVKLRGRLAAPVELRNLPSGDTLLVFRLVVRRPAPRPREPRQDTFSCVSFHRALISRSSAWQEGDVLEVEGALRRRFWRSATGMAVAHEIDCHRVRKARGAAGETRPPADTA